MLQIPFEYKNAVAALLLLPTGRALLLSPRTACVRAVISYDLGGAYGKTPDAKTIHLTHLHAQLSLPQQACIIAHELTHAHDLSFTGLSAEMYRDTIGLADTEINGHFNQGKVLREFRDALALFPNHRSAINAACNGSTVFGRSVDWATRIDVASYLQTTMYASHVKSWYQGAGIWSDDMYVSAIRPFHCDENWHAFSRVRPIAEMS